MLLSSCQGTEDHQGNVIYVDAIPPVDTLYGRKISLEPELLNVRDLVVLDDEYLIIAEEREDEIFKVFRLPDMEFLYSWGRKGEGPGEIPTQLVDRGIIGVSDRQLVLYAMGVVSLFTFQVSDTAMTFLDREMIMYDGMQNPFLNRLTRLNDSTYIAVYGSGLTELYAEEDLIALEPGNRTPLFTFGAFPETDLTGREQVMATTKALAAKPNGSRLIAFYVSQQFFRIYNGRGELIREVHINEDPEMGTTYVGIVPSYRGFNRATENFIYVRGSLWSNSSRGQNSSTRTLEIWRWDGTPYQRFFWDPDLKFSSASTFTVSDRYNRLYAIVIEDELGGELGLYEFDLGQ
ncbi:MAG: hypothetical protein WDZ29_06155 [Balneolaceae bacterium]